MLTLVWRLMYKRYQTVFGNFWPRPAFVRLLWMTSYTIYYVQIEQQMFCKNGLVQYYYTLILVTRVYYMLYCGIIIVMESLLHPRNHKWRKLFLNMCNTYTVTVYTCSITDEYWTMLRKIVMKTIISDKIWTEYDDYNR